jgi:hypothetical protein
VACLQQAVCENKFLSCPTEIGHPDPREGKSGSPLDTCGDDIRIACLCDPAAAGEAIPAGVDEPKEG